MWKAIQVLLIIQTQTLLPIKIILGADTKINFFAQSAVTALVLTLGGVIDLY